MRYRLLLQALVNFDSILAASDGIMVARGDLGVEIPMETLTNVQKDLVRRSNLAGNRDYCGLLFYQYVALSDFINYEHSG
jgi:hypothetical protein